MKNNGKVFDRRCLVLAFLPIVLPATFLLVTYAIYKNHFNIALFSDLSSAVCMTAPLSIGVSILFIVDNSKKMNPISRRITYGYIALLSILVFLYFWSAVHSTVG
jgi:hypothetical protein